MKNKVYLLQHSYICDECEETKIIGVFSTYDLAKKAIKKYQKKKGFKKYKKNFYIDEYKLDKKFWRKGFFKTYWDK